MSCQIIRTAVYLALSLTLHADEPDLLFADFEGNTYGTWQTTGDAFGPGPARGTLPNQMHVDGFEGKGLVNTFFKGDASTGTLTSPPFKIERKFINFLIGGGKHEAKSCINLRIDGKVVRTASGPNDKPGGSEHLDWNAWDVVDLQGKNATIEIVDMATGGWGHINVDQILQSNIRCGVQPARRDIVINQDFLLIPVRNAAAKRQMRFLVDGQVVREFEIELGDRETDFVVSANVTAYRGKTLTMESMLPFDSEALSKIQLASEPPSLAKAEPKRPRFHFTSRRGWLNDPNGLVYYKNEWHLFYQHNPYGWNWGNMHWGHAVSRDLLHWQELPTAIYPKQWGDWAFSGSAVVDAANSSGFKTGDEAVLVAAYTSTGRGECIAYSNDRGRTWTEFDRNPVVRHHGRDPKIIWHPLTQRWIMAVYDEAPGQKQAIVFYSSLDLKEWTQTGRIEGFYECPDLFALPVDGDQNHQKWVLYGADGKYLVGEFDGRGFQSDTSKQQVWYGNFYAAQTFSDAPDGRRVQIGWANGITFPGEPYNQQMTIPVELTLRTTATGIRLFAWPVRELAAESARRNLALASSVADPLELSSGQPVTVTGENVSLDLYDLSCELNTTQAERVTLTLCGTPIIYDVKARKLTCRNVSIPVTGDQRALTLRVVGDRGSLEIFVNSGEAAVSLGFAPSGTDRTCRILAEGGAATVRQLKIGDVTASPQ